MAPKSPAITRLKAKHEERPFVSLLGTVVSVRRATKEICDLTADVSGSKVACFASSCIKKPRQVWRSGGLLDGDGSPALGCYDVFLLSCLSGCKVNKNLTSFANSQMVCCGEGRLVFGLCESASQMIVGRWTRLDVSDQELFHQAHRRHRWGAEPRVQVMDLWFCFSHFDLFNGSSDSDDVSCSSENS